MKTILLDFYLEIRTPYAQISESKLNAIEESLLILAFKDGADLLNQPVEVYVLCDEGSLKTWVIILGLYHAIGNYGDFRGGLREVKNDISTLSDKFKSVFGNFIRQ